MAYSDTGYLYVIKAEDGGVKIGISTTPNSRIDAIESASGRPIVRKFVSPAMPEYDLLEKCLHAHFAKQRVAGEWFNIDFDEAVREAHHLGAISHPDHWNKSTDYVQGALHRKRLVQFSSTDRHEAEMQAFLHGMGELARAQVEYAEMVDAEALCQSIGRVEQLALEMIEQQAFFGISHQPPPETLSALAEIASQIKQDMIEFSKD